MTWYRDPAEGWAHHDDPQVILTDGPHRIYDDSPTPDPPRNPIGFRVIEVEPRLWDGDNA